MSRRDLHLRVSIPRGRRPVWLAALVTVVALATVGLASAGVKHGNRASAPTKGGTLVMLGASDIFNLDTTSGYYTVTSMLERMFTRQLVSYPTVPSFLAQIQLKPDAATSVPTIANGGVTGGGKTYTFHIKPGVKWDTPACAAGDGGRTSCASSRWCATRLRRPARRATTRDDRRHGCVLRGLREGEGRRPRRSART